MRNISECPDKWIILKLQDSIYKVFGTWAGGYLNGDQWKLNSGISHIEQDDDSYYIYGHSGSCYKCSKSNYGVMTNYGQSVLDNMLETAKSKNIKAETITMTDFIKEFEK